MKTYRGKPSWENSYKLNPETGQWTPPPSWATHILKASATEAYTWAEKCADGSFVGEPRYRGGVQSRDCMDVGPGAWQVVEARPTDQQDQQTIAELRAEVERLRAFEADVELETVAWLDVSEATDHMTPTERVLQAVKAMRADAKAHQEARRADAFHKAVAESGDALSLESVSRSMMGRYSNEGESS